MKSSLCYNIFTTKHNNNKDIQAIAHCTTVFHQMLQIFSRHEFDRLAEQHHIGQKFRSFNRWAQFGALFMGQLTDRKSLRDIATNITVHVRKLYHLGFANISRATLARTNEKQPASLYEILFAKLLKRCQHLEPGNRFKLKNLYLLDSSTIDLCYRFFPGQRFAKPRAPSNCIWNLTLTVIFPHLST